MNKNYYKGKKRTEENPQWWHLNQSHCLKAAIALFHYDVMVCLHE